MMNWKEIFEKELKTPYILNAPLGDYTTYKVGGAAEVLALPKTEEQIKEVYLFALKNKISFRVLGLGSNVLVPDEGLRGVTCCLKNFYEIKIEGNILSAQSGAPLDRAVALSIGSGLEGMQKLSGIPGSVGGAVFMNAGAFGGETFDFLKSFKVLLKDGSVKVFQKDEISHSYRNVQIPEGAIVLQALWVLNKKDCALALEERRNILLRRAQKQPLEYPSAGSVFKRPEGDFASRLIDVCGLRGLSVGGAMVSQKHAGFIINYNKASSRDIRALIKEVQAKVFEKTGVRLELEQILW